MASLINGLSAGSGDPVATGAGMPLLGLGAAPADAAGMNRVLPGPRANHMGEADAAMSLSPEEKFLYNTHLANLNGTGKIVHPDGSISSLLQMSFEQDGKFYNIPTVVGGRQLAPDDAIKAAEKVGLDRFPSYSSEDEAEARYNALHEFLGRDTADFIAGAGGASR